MRFGYALSGAATIALVATAASAADRVVYYGAPPSWVKPADLPPPPEAEPGAASSLVLYDEQTRYDGLYGETTLRTASKVISEQGLDDLGSIVEDWDPETERVTVNRVAIIRDGKVIDVLKSEKFEVLRRETNLESAMLNGQLTATLQLKDLRVGDIVDVQVSRRYRDPLGSGRFDSTTALQASGTVGRMRIRLLWPKGAPLRWRTTEGFPKTTVTETATGSELLVDASNLKHRRLPVGAPMRYAQAGTIEWTQLSDWSEVSALLAGLYATAGTLKPNSPLLAEVERIRAASPDPLVRATLALKLVETQVRYVYIGMGAGAYAPAAADETWTRRFGDCKAKTALLMALLKALDIPAEAALVNSDGWGDGMEQRLPSLARFDHVIVRATIGDEVYWLDGTRQGDEALANLQVPAYGWALPVRAKAATLERLTPKPLMLAQDSTVVRIDAAAGLETPAKVTVEAILRGDQAISSARTFASQPRDDVSRGLRRGWGKMLGWVDFETADWSYDAPKAELTMRATGSGKLNLVNDPRLGQLWPLPISELFAPGYERDSEQDQTAPYAINYPYFDRTVVYATLPKTDRYRLSGMFVKQTLGGYDVTRAAYLRDNQVLLMRSSRAVGPEITAEDAKASQEKARRGFQAFGGYVVEIVNDKTPGADPVGEGFQALGERRYDAAEAAFRTALKSPDFERGAYAGLVQTAMARKAYPQALKLLDQAEARLPGASTAWLGMRVDVLWASDRREEAEAVAVAAAAKSPKDPEVLLVLARTQLAREKYDAALATARQAQALDPKSADAVLAEGRALFGRKDPAGALKRGLAAQALEPNNVEVLSTVAAMQLRLKQPEAALVLTTEAIRIDPLSAGLQASRADVLDQMGRTDEALAMFDAALSQDPKNVTLLNGRCWLRATRNRELDKARADCDQALALRPDLAAALDSRALVNFRAARFDAALRDYDQALKLAPKQGASLFGRGLTRLSLGDRAGAEADLVAARGLDAEVETRFAEWGLKP
ncbi:DUF3857 domain-containing protein [Caulobacter segnis]|nr:DUF3857 domain-containing protein [Caulobacter segnis]